MVRVMPLWSALSRALPGLRLARERVQRFLSRPRRPRDGAIRLDRRHVYILPTAPGPALRCCWSPCC